MAVSQYSVFRVNLAYKFEIDCEALNNFWVQYFIVIDRMGPNYSYGSGLEDQAIF